jgi:hypothetical protein
LLSVRSMILGSLTPKTPLGCRWDIVSGRDRPCVPGRDFLKYLTLLCKIKLFKES